MILLLLELLILVSLLASQGALLFSFLLGLDLLTLTLLLILLVTFQENLFTLFLAFPPRLASLRHGVPRTLGNHLPTGLNDIHHVLPLMIRHTILDIPLSLGLLLLQCIIRRKCNRWKNDFLQRKKIRTSTVQLVLMGWRSISNGLVVKDAEGSSAWSDNVPRKLKLILVRVLLCTRYIILRIHNSLLLHAGQRVTIGRSWSSNIRGFPLLLHSRKHSTTLAANRILQILRHQIVSRRKRCSETFNDSTLTVGSGCRRSFMVGGRRGRGTFRREHGFNIELLSGSRGRNWSNHSFGETNITFTRGRQARQRKFRP
mmetsp:Transcript_21220/g.45983  ORF Transcript_21220/g.45983 Transcript_21220/m.45983 type:complete len:315 (+) Transcript_21220:572-1516(+)